MNSNGSLAGKTILLVNTGSIKKKFILKKLKKMELTVVALNKEKNWADGYVDHWVLADTNNHSQALEALDSFLTANPAVKIDGVITFWEDDVLLTARISDRLDLIGIPFKIAKKARNKYLFREFCKENKIKTPQHTLLKSKDLDYVSQNFNFPLVIKPAYGSSSAFVVKVENKEELANTYNYVKKNISTTAESALSDGLEILAEEYIDGEEVDINIILQNGKIKFSSIVDNYKTEEPFFIETQWAIPSNLPRKDQQALIEMAEMILEKLGVQNGCIHFEAKVTKDGPVPIEANLRMGGDETYSFTKEAWQVDLIENIVKIALGVYIEKIKKPEIPHKYLISYDFTPGYSGILVKLDVDENIKKNEHLEESYIFKKIGDPILVPPEGYEYLGWVSVSGNNPLDAEDNLKNILKYIKYEVVKFDPASSIGKTLRRNRFSSAAMNKDLLKGIAKIERIKRFKVEDQRKLHIGVACNIYQDEQASVELDLTSIGKNIEKTLKEKGYKVTFFDFNNLPKAFNDLRKSNVDLVFNVCERINNSSLLEPHVAAILDTLQIPYTGSNPFTLGLCIDKIRVKKLLNYHGIPTPKWDYAYSLEDKIDEDLKYPLIIKPANSDNSIGITNDSVVTDKKGLEGQIKKVTEEMDQTALVEEYIEGDEYDVSILGSEEDDLRVLPLSRSIFDKMPEGFWHIYPFDAKWTDNPAYKTGITVQRPAKNISKKLESLITEISLDTYNILDCHDYGRVEVRVDKNNNPYVLELNPNPSINIGDCVPGAAEFVGMNYADFLEEIIRMAVRRYKNRPPYYHLQGNFM